MGLPMTVNSFPQVCSGGICSDTWPQSSPEAREVLLLPENTATLALPLINVPKTRKEFCLFCFLDVHNLDKTWITVLTQP